MALSDVIQQRKLGRPSGRRYARLGEPRAEKLRAAGFQRVPREGVLCVDDCNCSSWRQCKKVMDDGTE